VTVELVTVTTSHLSPEERKVSSLLERRTNPVLLFREAVYRFATRCTELRSSIREDFLCPRPFPIVRPPTTRTPSPTVLRSFGPLRARYKISPVLPFQLPLTCKPQTRIRKTQA